MYTKTNPHTHTVESILLWPSIDTHRDNNKYSTWVCVNKPYRQNTPKGSSNTYTHLAPDITLHHANKLSFIHYCYFLIKQGLAAFCHSYSEPLSGWAVHFQGLEPQRMERVVFWADKGCSALLLWGRRIHGKVVLSLHVNSPKLEQTAANARRVGYEPLRCQARSARQTPTVPGSLLQLSQHSSICFSTTRERERRAQTNSVPKQKGNKSSHVQLRPWGNLLSPTNSPALQMAHNGQLGWEDYSLWPLSLSLCRMDIAVLKGHTHVWEEQQKLRTQKQNERETICFHNEDNV